MSVFTAGEIAFLVGQRLGRLATLGRDGAPHVVPVGYRYNPDLDTLDLIGRGMATSKKLGDARRDPRVAFVVDAASGTGYPQGIEVRGGAEVIERGGEAIRPGADPQFIRIYAAHIAAWGIDGDPYAGTSRDVGGPTPQLDERPKAR
jgi:pyridoxamine 5'-phosphate oxidase family protein